MSDSLNNFDDEPDMLSEIEEQINARAQELLQKPLIESAKEIAAKAIASEELKSKQINKKLNLQGIAALLKVISELDGGDVVLSLPDNLDDAIKHLVKHRAKGELKSIQANDLANLLSKQKEAIEIQNIKEKLDELDAMEKANKIRREIKISYRDEEDNLDSNSDSDSNNQPNSIT